MEKQLNKVRDMSKARYCRIIHGDVEKLKRIALMYPECKPILRSDNCHYEGKGRDFRIVNDGPITKIVMKMTISEWSQLYNGLKCDLKKKEGTRQNKEWELV